MNAQATVDAVNASTSLAASVEKSAKKPSKRRCMQSHPLHFAVRCEELKGHDGDHFNSFFVRSWSDER